MAAIEVTTKGFDKATADQDRLNKTTAKHERVLNANKEEAMRSGQVLQRVLRDNETATEKFNRKMREATVALAGHAQEVEQLARTENRLQRELFETSQEYREGAKLAREMDEELKKRADAAVKREMEKSARLRRIMDEDARQAQRIAKQQQSAEDRLYDAERRLIDLKRRGAINDKQYAAENKRLQDEYQKELAETEGKLENIGEASESAFDASRVVKWGAAIVGPAALLSKTLSVMRDIRQEQEALANKTTSESAGAGQLAQFADGDPAKLKELFAAADATYAEGYVNDRGSAYSLMQELAAADLLKERRFASQLSLIDDPAKIVTAYGGMRSSFAGVDDIGSLPEFTSKLIEAAKAPVGTSPSEIGAGVATMAGSAKEFGFTDEQSIAMVSRVAEGTMDGAVAGTVSNSLLSTLINQGFADRLYGKGLEGIVSEIDSMGLDKQGMNQFFGDRNAFRAFQLLKDQVANEKRLAEVNNAQSTGLSQAAINSALGEERIASAVAKRSGEAANVLSQDNVAQERAFAEGEAQRRSSQLRNAGNSEFVTWLQSAADSTYRYFVGDDEAADKGRRRMGIATEETGFDRIVSHLEEQNRLTRELLGKTDEQTGTIKDNSPTIPVK